MVTDQLTPREREVFELLRVGLTNEEIANRLGITLDGAKYHVSSILSKLGVSSRDEAIMASLRAARPQRLHGAGFVLRLAAIGAAAVCLASVAFLAFGVLRTDDDTESPPSLTISSDDPLTVADYTPGNGPIGSDHWHASYIIFIGDEQQPNAPTWESGVHTHGDGIIHIHPFQSFEEGRGAALNKWFEYGGGELTETTMREPGDQKTYHAGDSVPGDGRPGHIYVMVNGQRVPPEYIPQDGDQVLVYFATEEAMRAIFPRRTPTLSSEGTATPPITAAAPPP
jgi:DNA-binding CsgD family transcriptional regulator